MTDVLNISGFGFSAEASGNLAILAAVRLAAIVSRHLRKA
jgi:hypothetical protein